ncbi:hypothetical protein ACFQZ4_09080 [Catellatospora coxensis]
MVNAAVPVHMALSGPYAWNVIVPVGLLPPASLATSWICPPNVMSADATVVRSGVARATQFRGR